MTTKTAARCRELYDQGMTDSAIANACNIPKYTVSHWRNSNGLPSMNRGKGRRPGTGYDYMIYLNKTDELLACGSSQQCADILGVSLESFYKKINRALRNETQKYTVVRCKHSEAQEDMLS